MPYFLCKLLPPRASFAQDMSPQEMEAMQRHIGYWSDPAQKSAVAALGLVADPAAFWGVGVIEADDETALQALLTNDPAITANVGLRYESFPMPRGIIHR